MLGCLTVLPETNPCYVLAVARGKDSNQELPAELVRARQLKKLGFGASAAAFGIGLSTAWVQDVALPDLGGWLLLVPALLVPFGAVLLLLAVTKDKAQIELHKGRLYVQWGSPSSGAPLAAGSVEVLHICLHLHTPMLCATYLQSSQSFPMKVVPISVVSFSLPLVVALHQLLHAQHSFDWQQIKASFCMAKLYSN